MVGGGGEEGVLSLLKVVILLEVEYMLFLFWLLLLLSLCLKTINGAVLK